MIYSLLTTITYMILFPMGLGTLIYIITSRDGIMKDCLPVTKYLDIYVEGVLAEFFIFECVGRLVFLKDSSLGNFYNYISKFWMALGIVTIIGVVVFVIKEKNTLLEFFKNGRRPDRRTLLIVLFILGYVFFSAMFVLPLPKDETVINTIVMIKKETIAVFSPYSEGLVTDDFKNIRLIEVYYYMLSEMTSVGLVAFVEYIANATLLIFFFGVYKRIECIVFKYSKTLKKEKKWIESAFVTWIVIRIFIGGSLNYAIPQNIYNGQTLLAACILPLGFAYGYSAICEAEENKMGKTAGMLIKMILLLPVASLMRNNGYQLMISLIGITLLVILFKQLISRVRDKREIREGE